MSKVKFHYYKIAVDKTAPSLDNLLQRLSTLSIANRTKTIYTTEIRLEHIAKNNGLWELCLTKVRSKNWPGVGSQNGASSDLSLPPQRDLTEHTYALIDPVKKLLVIQFTQGGVRASKVGMFLGDHAGLITAYDCHPVLTKDALTRYQNTKIFTRIDVGISGATAGDVAIFNGSPIGSAVKESVDSGIEDIEITFKVNAVDKRRALKSSMIRRLVSLVQKSDQATDLKIFGRDAPDSNVEQIDLLEEAKFHLVDEKEIGLTPGKRYNQLKMFEQLHIAISK